MMNKKYNCFNIMVEVIKASPLRFFGGYFFGLADGVLLGLSIFQLQKVFDSSIYLYNTGNGINALILNLIILLLIKIGSEISSTVTNYIGGQYYYLHIQNFLSKINIKSSKIKPIVYENQDSLNKIEKSIEGAGAARDILNVVMDIITLYIPYFFIISWYLWTLKPILVIIMLIVFVPVVLSGFITKWLNDRLEDTVSPIRRKKTAYSDYITKYEYIKETRNHNATNFFKKLYKKNLDLYNKMNLKLKYKEAIIGILANFIVLIGYVAIIILLISYVLDGSIGIGQFAAVFATVNELFSLMNELFCERLTRCFSEYPKMRNYIEFLNMEEFCYQGEEDSLEEKLDDIYSIKLNNVYYKYPNTDNYALEDINLEINNKDKIAIVGENGSGKTTLSKIIMGMYDNITGEVLYNGISSKKFNYQSILSKWTAVYQKYNKYKLSIAENVYISDFDNCYSNGNKLEEILEQLEFIIDENSFVDGENTLLAKEFGGTNLSGGQWQKLSISRGMYRERKLMVLDEPTSAIDPIQEYKIYKLFEKITKDKTAIIITHRLSSVKFCNKIVAMKNGKIVGFGTHDDLIENCGYYKELWSSQAMQYK